eukprot:321943-Chlamydomonas_euryale.AAC.5
MVRVGGRPAAAATCCLIGSRRLGVGGSGRLHASDRSCWRDSPHSANRGKRGTMDQRQRARASSPQHSAQHVVAGVDRAADSSTLGI